MSTDISNDTEICNICGDDLNNKLIYTTKCNHHFCKKCLYRWGNTCPLCRRYIVLDYPNTRAMSRLQHVIDNTSILLKNVANVKEPKYKIGYAEKLFQFLWDNRVYVRKHSNLCRTIHEKSAHVKNQCIKLGFMPPQILKKIVLI